MLLNDSDSGQAGAREEAAGDADFDSLRDDSSASPTPDDQPVRNAGDDDQGHTAREQPVTGLTKSALPGTGWRLLAAVAALLLTALTIAGIYLLTKKPSTIEQLVILTVPSGAEIMLDSKDYGNSPVKLEQLSKGTYTITITKEGFEPIVQQVTISDSVPLEFKLKPLAPSASASLPPEERVREYQILAEEAFANGYYGVVYEGSALSYADLIIGLEPTNSFAREMQERVRKAVHQSAQTALSRGDLAQAQAQYNFLSEFFPNDEEARLAKARVEAQLATRRGEVRGLVRKAEEALQAGNLIEPRTASAYYYSNQALAINKQDADARRVRNQVKERLAAQGEQSFARGDMEGAARQYEQIAQLFAEDKQLRGRLREIVAARNAEAAKATDPNTHRVRGLALYREEDFAAAIPELQLAVANGLGRTDVVFALARSYMKTGELDKASSYFHRVPESPDDSYRSSIAALGEIAMIQGDTATAVDRFKRARRLGGSVLYPITSLDDKIERIERREREKASEPTPLSIQVRHLHGGLLGGSCSGPLSVASTGVRFDGSEHTFSANLVGVGVRIAKDELTVQFQNNSQKFKAPRAQADRFREALSRYQQSSTSGNR